MAPNLSKSKDGLLGDVVAVDGLIKPPRFTLKGKDLAVDGHPFLLDVPANVRLTPASTLVATAANGGATAGSFLGFDAPAAKDRHVVPIGKLRDTRFMSIFRFKVWWTTHWVGMNGRDVENETQMMILDRSGSGSGSNLTGRPYVLLLPIIEGPFRACLEAGKVEDYVDMVIESGSSTVKGSVFWSALYLHAGDDPFDLVKEAVRVVRAHLGTFRLLEEKTPPPIVDKFGWCTWDAFYLKVHPEGVWEGVRRLADGGCPPGMVLIDDGWQSICHDDDDPGSGAEGMNRTSAGEQMPCRLIKFEENRKFRERGGGMGGFVREMKAAFPTVEQVYVWHALCGYWGGLRPGAPGLPPAKVVAPRLSPGLRRTMEDLAVDKIVSNGVGLVDPRRARELYEGLHSHLQASGIDGVKVDVIHLLEMVCEEYGGRVELAKAYFGGLTESVRRHFNGNGVIASMEHCNDFMLLGTEAVALGRVGDDFWCTDPAGDPNGTFWLQGCHMVHCAYNSLWMGNFIHPDWDMFQSTHPCAAFHAASRAVSGGPVYVSDAVGCHDFGLLRRLALPDGTILRCERYALPARDCLFADPLHDGRTLLKIWNVNRFSGVLGAFNCQGGGWSPEARRNMCASEFSVPVTARAGPADVEWRSGGGESTISVKGVSHFAVYFVEARKLQLLRPDESVELTLEPFTYELLVVAPVRAISPERDISFAPIGLANMLNAGGAVQGFDARKDGGGGLAAEVAVKGAGDMVVYSSARPRQCRVNGQDAEFKYVDGMVTVDVQWTGSSSKLSRVEYLY
ncbi:galactinol--sucrose galactosyltransferase [Oryza brachyantha]|uniref:galactinol--sucrose galactosyltransferase n=1 Tax=Oryza brachyantha TaxID=4533 RepID=UPI001ADD08E1|nr:galactinol--sucrose galactosyltransferase [Oryza brachyantha]